MSNPTPLRYFLGANSGLGFRSLYGGFCPAEEGCFLYVIKGGPGCGKSSFMGSIARAAEKRGLAVEYVLCSGDPDSLDGIYIPDLALGYVDGTAPHVLDARFPGSCSAYVDLGRFYDSTELRRNANSIIELNGRYGRLYKLAYGHIAAAAALKSGESFSDAAVAEKLEKKAAAFIRRELMEHASGSGKVRHCFMGAVSCKGALRALDGIAPLGGRLCLLDNELGFGNIFLSHLAEERAALGHDCMVCHDSLEPEKIEALLYPALGLYLCCALPKDAGEGIYRHLRLDAMANRAALSLCRARMRRSTRLSRECIALAVDTLAHAKALHDELEGLYNPFVDFDGVYSEAEKHIAKHL